MLPGTVRALQEHAPVLSLPGRGVLPRLRHHHAVFPANLERVFHIKAFVTQVLWTLALHVGPYVSHVCCQVHLPSGHLPRTARTLTTDAFTPREVFGQRQRQHDLLRALCRRHLALRPSAKPCLLKHGAKQLHPPHMLRAWRPTRCRHGALRSKHTAPSFRAAWRACSAAERRQLTLLGTAGAALNLGFGVIIPALPVLSQA